MKKLAKTVFSLALALCLVLSLGGAAFADTYYIEDGSITVNASESGQTVSQGDAHQNTPDAAPIISNRDSETASSNTVTINAEAGATANVTFDDLNISSGYDASVSVIGDGDVSIELDGNNSLLVGDGNSVHAALEKNDATSTGTLTITDKDGDGKLMASSTGGYGAGIGGSQYNSTSNITIEGGEINASAAKSAAGIGGGSGGTNVGGSAENIRITGGKIDATGGAGGGAGIGSGGRGEYARDIVISGDAEVKAGGYFSAGIGGGSDSKGTSITISGNAKVNASSVTGGAIGSGEGGSVDSIVISDNAEVTAEIDTEKETYGSNCGVPFGAGYGKEFAPDTSKLTSKGSVKTIDSKKNENTIVGAYTPPPPAPAPESSGNSAEVIVLPIAASYHVIDGKDAEWVKGSGEALTFRLSFHKVEKVLIDGTEVDFDINDDGDVVISADTLETLTSGNHEIRFVFPDGSCKTNITVK